MNDSFFERFVVVSGPSGVGKTALVQRLLTEHPNVVIQSISCTTRNKRVGEVDGKDYFFLTRNAFVEKIQQNEFLEYTELFGHFYGTLKKWVEVQIACGYIVLLVIDTAGAKQIKTLANVASIFIKPPSMAALKKRLYKRGTESENALNMRLAVAKQELAQAAEYDECLINDDFVTTYQKFKKIILSKQRNYETRINK